MFCDKQRIIARYNSNMMKQWLLTNYITNNRVNQSICDDQRFSIKFPEQYIEIKSLTAFLAEVKLSERIYCALNDITNNVKCSREECENNVRFSKFSEGYKKYCSALCASIDPVAKQKSKETQLAKYGVENYAQTEECTERVKSTNLDRYGATSPLHSDIIKPKVQKTNLERYGHANASKSDAIKQIISESKITEKKVRTDYTPKQPETRPIAANNIEQLRDLLKKWIMQNCIGENGLNPRTASKSYLEKFYGPIYTQICVCTSFIAEDAKANERLYCLINDITEIPKCKICDKNVRFVGYSIGYKTYCSDVCGNSDISANVEKSKATQMAKYGVENYNSMPESNAKKEATNIERYGVKNAMQNAEVRAKAEETNIERYGSANVFVNPAVKEKIKQKNLLKYGVENPMQNQDIIAKAKINARKTSIARYGVNSFAQINIPKESLEKLNSKQWLIEQHHDKKRTAVDISKELSVASTTVQRYLHLHEIEIKNFFASTAEKEIDAFLKEMSIETVLNSRRIIDGKELDIYIPSHNLAIEFDGLYYHSYDNYLSENDNKNNHLRKTQMCASKGIQLLHVFQDEWIDDKKQEIWKSIIKSKLNMNNKIHARKCVIKEIASKEASVFLDENHLQGKINAPINIALYFEDIIVCVACFGKSRYNENYEYELLRFANIKYHNTIGGMSKALSYFIKQYNPKSIISYSDLRYSAGAMYNQIGMTAISISNPSYFYFKPGKPVLYSRFMFQKHKLYEKLPNFNASMSEAQNMFNHGFRRMWDCGNMVFEWRKNDI